MIEPLTLSAALLMGLGTSGHCLLMCGGIASASGIVAMPGRERRPPLSWLLASQFGRILSYGLAGWLAAGVVSSVVAVFGVESIRTGLRILSALALMLAAAVIAGWIRDPGRGPGGVIWRRLAPLTRSILPLRSISAAFGFGMIWGWMPCGFVYSALMVATLAADPWLGAAFMVLFGLGTLPAMLAIAAGATALPRLVPARRFRGFIGALLLASAALTLIAPWLPLHGSGHDHHRGGHGEQ